MLPKEPERKKKNLIKNATTSFYFFISLPPHLVVSPDRRCLPAPVVAAGVAVVQLEAVVLVPTREKEGHTERPQSPELCVRLETNLNIYTYIHTHIYTYKYNADKREREGAQRLCAIRVF